MNSMNHVVSNEVTGSVHRVQVAVAHVGEDLGESVAVELAQNEIGFDITPAWTAKTDFGYEVVFERGDYL